MGQVYFDMGILASPEVIECSASDLVGQYVGQTGPKTRALFDKGLGKVLFVDEAYRLAEGHFAQEAVDELVGLLTHETYKGRIIVILAGYDQDMKRLMQSNTGLNSRFPEWVPFQDIHPRHCLEIVIKELKKKNVAAPELFDEQSTAYVEMTSVIEQLAKLPDWGNARDMVQLGKDIVNKALLSPQDPSDPANAGLSITGKDAVACAESMRQARLSRSRVKPKQRDYGYANPPPVQQDVPTPPPPPSTTTATGSKTAAPPPPPPAPQKAKRSRHRKGKSNGSATPSTPTPQTPVASTSALPGPPEALGVARDPGVSDAVWADLQSAIRAQAEREQQERESIAKAQREQSKKEAQRRAAEQEAKRLAEQIAAAQDAARRAELERKRIAALEKAARVAAEKARIAEQIRREQQAAAERKRQEEKAQQKLRAMGVCPVGYQWIPEGDGYRCAGGSHFVTRSQLGL